MRSLWVKVDGENWSEAPGNRKFIENETLSCRCQPATARTNSDVIDVPWQQRISARAMLANKRPSERAPAESGSDWQRIIKFVTDTAQSG